MSENSVTFENQGGGPLYYLVSESKLPLGYCIAFLPGKTNTAESLSLDESWDDNSGLYLFLKVDQEQLDQARFVSSLQQRMLDPAFSGTRFIWIENPLEPSALWVLNFLSISGHLINATTGKRAIFNFQNFSLRIARDIPISLNDSKNGFTLTRPTYETDDFLFTTGMGANRLRDVGSTIDLTLSDEYAGCLQFDLTVGKDLSSNNGIKPDLRNIASLDISLRVFFQDDTYPHTVQPDRLAFLTSQRYPFLSEEREDGWHHFEQGGTTFTLLATLDPLNPLDEERTFFSFDDKAGHRAAGIPSCYRTNMGDVIYLNPQDDGRLVFARRPIAVNSGNNDPYYLVPSGKFELTVPRNNNGQSDSSKEFDDNLLCGLSGVEYIKLAGTQAHLLSFNPKQNAYAANFSPGKTLASTELTDAFQGAATTAWGYVHAQEGIDPIYYSQPEEAVLHNEIDALAEAAKNDDLRDDLLEYMEVPSGVLPGLIFSKDSILQRDLDSNTLSEDWNLSFQDNNIFLEIEKVEVTVEVPDFRWRITDTKQDFIVWKIIKEIAGKPEETLDVYHPPLPFPILPYGSVYAPSITDYHPPAFLFSASSILQRDLEKWPLSNAWQKIFESHNITLVNPEVEVEDPGYRWRIPDNSEVYVVQKHLNDRLDIYTDASSADEHSSPALFSADIELLKDLDECPITESWKLIFDSHGISFENATITVEVPGFSWRIKDIGQAYLVQKYSEDLLNIYVFANIAQQLEQQLISPKRREIIHQINATVDDPDLLPDSYPDAVRIFRLQKNPDGSFAISFISSATEAQKPIALFSAEPSLQNELVQGPVTEACKQVFEKHGISLSQATVTVEESTEGWLITDLSRTGVSQQGLLTIFSNDYKIIKKVVLAIDTDNDSVALTDIAWNTRDSYATALRTALQTAQLFMVVSTKKDKEDKEDALKDYFKQNQLTIQGWTFDLNPDSWQKHDTILIFKFNDRPFEELVENISMWSQPQTFNDDPQKVKIKLLKIIKEVLAKDTADAPPKDRENYRKLANAFRNRFWSGIIALNVNVPPRNLPDELKGISGAIDSKKFYAQYIGIEITPVTVQSVGLVPGQSSLFGLIDYKDDASQNSADSDYNFQVTSLNVRFQNSEVQAFSCELGVTLNLLFGERTQLQNGPAGRNIVVLKGTAEKHDDHMIYAFNFSGDNRFETPRSQALDAVEIIKAQFSTDPGGGNHVNAHFSFWGRLNYTRLKSFDVLSFGAEDPDVPSEGQNEKYLSFSNMRLLVSFDIDPATGIPNIPNFVFYPRNLAIDLKRSGVRNQSLFAKFPLKFTSFFHSTGDKTIENMGYMPVKSPLSGGKVDNTNWYGLTFNLELGSLGALSNSPAFVVSIIAAWSPSSAEDKESKGVFVGLRLPGSTGGKKEIVLQGLLKLTFKTIEFVVGTTDEGNTSYLLKLKNIVIKFFVLSMPPSGQTEIVIFGDPAGTPDNKTLGWYAAYAKK